MDEAMKQKRWFHRHPVLTLSAVSLLGCITILLLLEIGARALRPTWYPFGEERVKFCMYDPLLGWAHQPLERGRFKKPPFSIGIAINSHGMRDSEYSLKRTEKKRMLVIGDSFGWGYGVEHNERFSEILEKIHPNWEIINASVSGYGTDQEYLYLRERGIAFRPDVVLLLFSTNDIENNGSEEQYTYYKPFFTVEGGKLKLKNNPVPRPTAKQTFERFLMKGTYIGTRFTKVQTGALAWFRSFSGVTYHGKRQGPDDDDANMLVTGQLIKAINEVCIESGSTFVLVAIPSGPRTRAALQTIAEKEKIPLLLLDPFFEKPASDFEIPYDGHWNAKGHEMAAEAIDGELVKLGIFTSPRSSLGRQ
jgi:hypothetical protein